MDYIKSINWILTYQCNLRCTHCDIWENTNAYSLSLDEVKNIFSSQIIQESYRHYWDLFDIALSGWEPLLLRNLEGIYDLVDSFTPWAIHSISTNGSLEKRLLEFLIHIHKKGRSLRKINISLDGNKITHNSQRGNSKSFQTSLKTIQKIKKVFPKQIIEIKLTITKQNFEQISFFTKLARELGVFFSFKPVENMLGYTNQIRQNNTYFSPQEIEKIEKQITNNLQIEEQHFYIHSGFFKMIPEYLRNGLWEKKKYCNVAKESITLMPDGKIYACNLMECIWDVKDEKIDAIWIWKNIVHQRQEIEKWNCPECMLMCGSFKSKNMYVE